MPKYSVIIPVYNAECYLMNCINSILGQNYTDYELILINDCSMDKSLQICRKYAEENEQIRLINQDRNRGVSAARNRGIDEAKGKYILFVDSDDHLASEYFQTIEKMEALYHDEEMLMFGHYDYLINQDGLVDIRCSSMNCVIDSEQIDAWRNLFLQAFFASPWNKVYVRAILNQHNIRFDTECVCYEDYLFNVAYCKCIRRFRSVDTPLYYYRQVMSINPVSKRKWGKRFAISEKVALATDDFIATKGTDDTLSDLRRYTYKSFLVELEASYLSRCQFETDLMNLIQSQPFNKAVNSITPCGKLLFIYKIARKSKLYVVCRWVLKRLIHV